MEKSCIELKNCTRMKDAWDLRQALQTIEAHGS